MFYKKVILLVLLSLGIYASPCQAWLIFHKPEFRGRVIDAEDKKPIEGAVAVAIYSKKAIRWAPESVSIEINVREALTDKDGIFRIPAYTTIIDPLSWSKEVAFVIFKPGYGRFPDQRIQPTKGINESLEDFFSKDFGVEKEILVKDPWVVDAEYKNEKVIFGLVTLPKLKTQEDRLKALRGIPGDFDTPNELPLYYKAINEEDEINSINKRNIK